MDTEATQRKRITATLTTALLTLVVVASLVAPAGAAPVETYTEVPTFVPPSHADVVISPQQGLAGSAITVKLTFTPPGACGLPAIALRTKPGPVAGSNIVSLSFSLAVQPDGSHVGTLYVPSLASPGTVYYADGGCIGSAGLISPPQPFLVTAPDTRAVPPERVPDVPPPDRR